MSPHIHLLPDDDVLVIEIDNPPVNALSTAVAHELGEAVTAAGRDSRVKAIVIACAGRTFVAGADVTELEAAARGEGAGPPALHDLLAQVEDSTTPVVMALHGTALGGGVELAMAGHYRVAAADTRMGMPEVTLGIIPGAEGTQRLPRLVGIEEAIALCVSGRPISAAEALRIGLIDRVIDGDIRTGSIALAREVAGRAGQHPRTRDRKDRLVTPEAAATLAAAGRVLARKTHRHLEAPLRAVDAIEAAASLTFADGCRRELEIMRRQMDTTEARALMYAFFAERAVQKAPGASAIGHRPSVIDGRLGPEGGPKGPKGPSAPKGPTVDLVAILGAGTMGAGIAMACANAGMRVTLMDVDAAAVDRGVTAIRKNYDSSVKRGRLTEAQVVERQARIQTAVGYEGCAEADLVIEAVFESLDLKLKVFADIDRVAKPGAVLATNTSTLDIDRIASATTRPDSVVGLHFFSPAHVMRLVEIVRGTSTSDATLATALTVAKRLGKVGVVVRNGPGFVGNRMMFPYMYEAQFLAEDGTTPEQVDRVLTEFGMAMGIFAVDDMGGLDVAWRVRKELHQFEEPGARRPLVSERLVELGRLGQKTGRGWYRYGDDRKAIPDPDVVALIDQTTHAAGLTRRTISDTEILERTIYALINEGARVLEDGTASRAIDIDVIYLTGYGFPRHRGGPMFYADTVGLPLIYERIAAFERELGQRWAPAPLLRRLAQAGAGEPRTFREFDARRSGGR